MARTVLVCAVAAVLLAAVSDTAHARDERPDSAVAAEKMPAFPGKGLYLWTARGPEESAEAALDALRGAGVEVLEAWKGEQSRCMRMVDPPQLLVRVRKGGAALGAARFAPDGTLDPCYTAWRRLAIPAAATPRTRRPSGRSSS